MKKIVVKMRSFKKLFGGDLLQLALLLSLLKVGSQFSFITMRLFINSFPPPTTTSKNQLNYVKYYNEILPRNFFSIVFLSPVKSTECTGKIVNVRPTVDRPPSLPLCLFTVKSC